MLLVLKVAAVKEAMVIAAKRIILFFIMFCVLGLWLRIRLNLTENFCEGVAYLTENHLFNRNVIRNFMITSSLPSYESISKEKKNPQGDYECHNY